MGANQAAFVRDGRRYLHRPAKVRFPTDRQVPEDKLHTELRTALFQLIQLAFRDRAIVGSDQFVYFDAGNPQRRLSPDVMVWVGAPDEIFGAWKVWERGAPHVAVEIVSRNDSSEKAWQKKLARYAQCGVREVVRFDPISKRKPRLRIWDRVDGDLVERDVSTASGRRCDALDLYWCVAPDPWLGVMLRLARDADSVQLLPTLAESTQQAIEETARLAAELARRG
jgi:hypothetical protein